MHTEETKRSIKFGVKKWAIFAATVFVFSAVVVAGYAPGSAMAAGTVAAGGQCPTGNECTSGLTCTQGYCLPPSLTKTCNTTSSTADGCDDADGYVCMSGTCFNTSTQTVQPVSSTAATLGTLGIFVTGETGNSDASLAFGVSPTYSMTATVGGIGANYACTQATCGNYKFAWTDNGKPINGCSNNYTCSDTIQNPTSTSRDSVMYVLTDSNGGTHNSAAINLTHDTNTGDNSGLSGGGLSFGIVVVSEDVTVNPSPFNLSATVGGVTCNNANNNPSATPPTNLCGVYGMAWSANNTPIPGCSNTWNCNYSSPDLNDSVTYTVTSNGTVIGTSGVLKITPNTTNGSSERWVWCIGTCNGTANSECRGGYSNTMPRLRLSTVQSWILLQ